MNFRSAFLLTAGLLLGIALTLSIGFINRPYTYQGSLIDPPVQAADFQLTDQNGQPFRLSDQRGKVVLIFFGYANCPDVCPVTLTQFKQIKDNLGKQADRVRFVFITVDPERDTQERLKAHMASYDPSIVALTGTTEELETVWKPFGVYREKVEDGSAAGYQFNHTSIVYVIDAQGRWRLTLPFGMDAKLMLEDVQHVIAGK